MKKTQKYKYFLKVRRNKIRKEKKNKVQAKLLRKKQARKQVISEFFGKERKPYKLTRKEQRFKVPNDKEHQAGKVISYFA